MERSPHVNGWKSPKKYSKQYLQDSTARTMISTYAPHTARRLRLFYGWGSSPGRPGMTNPISSTSHEVLFNSSPTAFFCNFLPPKPILSAKGSLFHCPHLGTQPALLLHYVSYSIVTPNHPLHRCSLGHMVHSIVHGCCANSHRCCYFRALIQRVLRVTHSVAALQIQRSKQVYHEQTSKRWGGGKATLLIDTFQPLLTTLYYSPSRPGSTPNLARQALHPTLFLHDRHTANLDDGSPFGESARLASSPFGGLQAVFPI